MDNNTILQGEALNLIFTMTDNSGSVITSSMVSAADWYCDGLRKTMANSGGITYDSTTQKWTVALTQNDTMSLHPGFRKFVFRFKFTDNQVIAEQSDMIKIVESGNKVIL